MRILVLSQYYPPEVGATQTRVEHFARHLSDEHDVTVIAELPNHPRGVIFEGFRGKLVDRRTEDGLDVVRVWVHASPKKSFWRRITFYLTYAVNAILAALLVVRRRPDVIFASSPPLPVLVVAAVLSLVWRRPYVADIRDIWPAVGVALGELRGEKVVAAAQRLERLLYRRAAAITVVTKGFVTHVTGLGIAPSKVHHVPNGTLPDVFTPERTDPGLRARLGLEDAFVVGYVGNHGIAQGLDAVIEAAGLLRDVAGVRFLFVGDGPVKGRLQERAARLGLDNVVFHDQVPLDQVTPYINACDLMLVPLRRLEVLDTFVPSKMFDFMACGKPVVLMVNGEARTLLDESGGGFYAEPENPGDLATLVEKVAPDPATLTGIGRTGREWVLERYSRDTQAKVVEAVVTSVAVDHGG